MIDAHVPTLIPTPTANCDSEMIEEFALRDGLSLAVERYQVSNDLVSTSVGENLLRFHVRFSGRRVVKFEERHELELGGSTTVVLMQDTGLSKFERIFGRQTEWAVTATVERERMREYLDEERVTMPSALNSLVFGKRTQPRMAVAKATREELDVAQAILTCRRPQPIRRMYIEAKGTELFCLVLDRLKFESGKSTQNPRLADNQRRQLERVRELLSCEFAHPPTIHQLSQRFGLNRNKLCNGFLSLFGCTIYDFCSALRLDRARELLAASQLSRTEIAWAAGYASVSAFSTAFLRRFGYSPSQLRREPATQPINVSQKPE